MRIEFYDVGEIHQGQLQEFHMSVQILVLNQKRAGPPADTHAFSRAFEELCKLAKKQKFRSLADFVLEEDGGESGSYEDPDASIAELRSVLGIKDDADLAKYPDLAKTEG